EVVVLEPHGPVVPQGVVHAHARGPTGLGTATLVIERRRNRGSFEVVSVCEGGAALQVEERRIERVADPARRGREPTLPRPTRVDAVRTNAFVLESAPSSVAFDADHPFSDLIIESNLAAEHGRVAGFRERAVAERPIAIGKAGADMAADIKPGPI